MRRAVGWFALVLALVACVAIGYGAYALAGFSWDAVVDYESPYAELDLPQAQAGSAVASTTVLVIVDGLRLDASRTMGTLDALRDYGADLELTAPEPSLSYPNWTTLLSGAPPYVSGVVTNWHEGEAPVESLFQTAQRAGAKTVFVGPEDFDPLYGVKATCDATYLKKWDDAYLSAEYVDAALRLAEQVEPQLLVVHLPDVDEAGHDYGGDSPQYAETVARVDADLRRLVEGLEGPGTVFVIVADHGHIDAGGHGGWEDDVVRVPGVFAGPGTKLGTGTGLSQDVAPTVALLAGVGVPRNALGAPLQSVLAGSAEATAARFAAAQNASVASAYTAVIGAGATADRAGTAAEQVATASAERLAADRQARLPYGGIGVLAVAVVLAIIGLMSWRALVAGLAGTVAYYALYNALYFLVHGHDWSLSAFNSEDAIDAWMNLRLIEAALAGLVAVAVAAVIYPLLRSHPKPPRDLYLPGWLALGPATVLVVLATLGLQVAWFVWAWGIVPVWRLPDLMWGFKYDLDLIQATALGFVALVTPLVTYLVGRYHPKVRPHPTEE